MTKYALANYASRGGARAGLVVADKLFDAAEALDDPRFATTLGALGAWTRFDRAVRKWLKSPDDKKSRGKRLSSARLLAPVQTPSAIFCAGANYTDHVNEMSRALNVPREEDPHKLGLNPWHFIKTVGTITGPDAEVEIPAFSTMVDWEAELVAVIGKPARNVSIDKALDHVAGYMIGNDLSARDHVSRPKIAEGSPFKFDWVSQKNWEGACPVGPWIVPASEISDPQRLSIKLSVNGRIRQDSHTSKMIFSTAEQVAHLSTRLTLNPGDLVLTGTPAGVGAATREFLKAGDVVRIEIEKIGSLTTTMVKPAR